MRSWGRSVRSIVPVIFLALLGFGCCSATPSEKPLGPPAGRPDELVLTSDPETWQISGGFGESDEMITLPYVDLERIIENRLRWRAYGRAWEKQRGIVADTAEVTSG